jgi:hypothetical protein
MLPLGKCDLAESLFLRLRLAILAQLNTCVVRRGNEP